MYSLNKSLIFEQTLILSEGKENNFSFSMLDIKAFKRKFESLKKNNDYEGVKNLLFSYAKPIKKESDVKKVIKIIKNNFEEFKTEFSKAVEFVKEQNPNFERDLEATAGVISILTILAGCIGISVAVHPLAGMGFFILGGATLNHVMEKKAMKNGGYEGMSNSAFKDAHMNSHKMHVNNHMTAHTTHMSHHMTSHSMGMGGF